MWRQLRGAGRVLGRGLLDLLFPPACLACTARLAPERSASAGLGERHFCEPCLTVLLPPPCPTCPRCAVTVGPHALVEGGCSLCRDERFAFAQAQRLGTYEGGFREMVLRLKNRGSEFLAELMGELWAAHRGAELARVGAEIIVPVPLHWRRRWRRGYNQSAALAHGLGKHLRLPVADACLRRVRSTPPQTSLSPEARRKNVRGAFAPRHPDLLQGRTILLVDDVMTTGATLHEAARALQQGGAARVSVAVLARAGLP